MHIKNDFQTLKTERKNNDNRFDNVYVLLDEEHTEITTLYHVYK